MKNILALFLLLFVLSGQWLYAQPIRKSSYEMTLVAARESYAKQDHVNALERYKEAYEEREDRALVDTIAHLYYRVNDYRNAERWFARILRRDREGKLNRYRYIYGQLLKINGKYDDAVKELQTYLETSAKGDSIRTLTKNAITGAEMAIELPPNLKGVTVENAGKKINTKRSEYTPSVDGNGKFAYFASFGTDDVTYMEADEDNQEAYARIYKSAKDDNGWEKPEELNDKINRPNFHNSNVTISPDGRTLFFSRALLQGNVLAESKIFYSMGGDEGWNGAEELKGVNGDYIAKHASPGELFAKQVLFFSSDMQGGYGGFDLYYATKINDGEYSEPVNLGPIINGPGDEETPHYRDGTLYFSSDGHPGLGGFDIFYAIWDGSKWSEPTNMGRGYNTGADDYGLTLDNDGYFGLLASNRPEGKSAYGKTCCADIYQVDLDRIVLDLLVGVFTEEKKALTGGTVYLVPTQNDKMGDPTAQNTGDNSNVAGFDLALDMPYMVIATHPKYYPDTTVFNTVGVTDSKSFEERMYLKPKPVPPPEPLYDTVSVQEAIVLENILYDFDDDRIREDAESDLQAVYDILIEYPDITKIELGSHTDKEGKDSYNEDLSQRRAESARRWLVRKGIDRTRIVAKGYGENQPQTVSEAVAARYDFLDEGDVLTEAFIKALEAEEQQEIADQLNRRTEFKIIEGPQTIVIKRIIKREQSTEGKDRGSNIGAYQPEQQTPRISPKSSLYGQKDLKNIPIMTFDRRFMDLGRVKKGEKRKGSFEFMNVGTKAMTISLISVCDCTTITDDPSGRTFQPGETGKIAFTFDSSEKDESEVIDIDIFLEENDNRGNPIIEMIQYKYELR